LQILGCGGSASNDLKLLPWALKGQQ